MPAICERTALFLPKVRQEATQNQRQKDRTIPGKEELEEALRAALRGEGEFIPRLSRSYNTQPYGLKNKVSLCPSDGQAPSLQVHSFTWVLWSQYYIFQVLWLTH